MGGVTGEGGENFPSGKNEQIFDRWRDLPTHSPIPLVGKMPRLLTYI